ncbi:MAG: hypothetical protein DRO40_13625 [Thermoprotei archaeon]|nr:MAG: hypothetical protein DRO40_13625 [Thermoprotei archaeon]
MSWYPGKILRRIFSEKEYCGEPKGKTPGWLAKYRHPHHKGCYSACLAIQEVYDAESTYGRPDINSVLKRADFLSWEIEFPEEEGDKIEWVAFKKGLVVEGRPYKVDVMFYFERPVTLYSKEYKIVSSADAGVKLICSDVEVKLGAEPTEAWITDAPPELIAHLEEEFKVIFSTRERHG